MKEKLKIIPLGGLNEIGKNMTVIEYGNDIVVIDCGVAFPDDDMLGVDLVIPDTTYLKRNLNKLRGYVITHGHEDHIGALPYILQKINVPVYGTKADIWIDLLHILINKISCGMVGSACKKFFDRFSLAAVFQCGHLIPPFSQ